MNKMNLTSEESVKKIIKEIERKAELIVYSPIDKLKTEKIISEFYEKAGFDQPSFIWTRSPFESIDYISKQEEELIKDRKQRQKEAKNPLKISEFDVSYRITDKLGYYKIVERFRKYVAEEFNEYITGMLEYKTNGFKSKYKRLITEYFKLELYLTEFNRYIEKDVEKYRKKLNVEGHPPSLRRFPIYTFLRYFQFIYKNSHALVDDIELMHQLIELKSNVFDTYIYNQHCILSEKPKISTTDKNILAAKLNNLEGPVFEFKDGYNFYYVNDNRYPRWIFEMENSKKKVDRIMRLRNVEKRKIAIEIFGKEQLLEYMESKVLDEKDEYQLLKFKIEDKWCEYLKMINPTTGETHIEGIRPGIKTVDEALAWRLGIEVYNEPIFKT